VRSGACGKLASWRRQRIAGVHCSPGPQKRGTGDTRSSWKCEQGRVEVLRFPPLAQKQRRPRMGHPPGGDCGGSLFPGPQKRGTGGTHISWKCEQGRVEVLRFPPLAQKQRRAKDGAPMVLGCPNDEAEIAQASRLTCFAANWARMTSSAASRHCVWSCALCVRLTMSATNCGPKGSVMLLQSK
jgi:hypothetical protein